jgi:serine/threonine-protein kinase
MGVVYEGHDPALDRTVAIKTIDLAFAATEEVRKSFAQRFLAEARASARLQHPSIVVVHDIGRDDAGVLFIALEYLRGQTVEQLLAEGRQLEWRRAVGIARRIAEGLQCAHEAGIVHRDVKPSNVMVLPSGETKILDFGIAKAGGGGDLTASGQTFGSPAYMSPEQVAGEKLDGRSDIFSLGSVLYEMLAGRRAFDGKGLPQILARVSEAATAPVRSLRPEVPEELAAILARAMQKDPGRRFKDAATFARALSDVETEAGSGFAATGTAVSDDAGVAAVEEEFEQSSPDHTQQSFFPGLRLPKGSRVSLAIVSGPGSGGVYQMDKARVTLGRSGPGATADIQVPDPEVSRMHALVQCDGQSFQLQDLGSTNGTFLDGQRIKTVALAPRSEFRIGKTNLLLIVADADASDPS